MGRIWVLNTHLIDFGQSSQKLCKLAELASKTVVFVPMLCPTANQAVDKDKNPGQNLWSLGTFMAPSSP